jgi:hypothetical protein
LVRFANTDGRSLEGASPVKPRSVAAAVLMSLAGCNTCDQAACEGWCAEQVQTEIASGGQLSERQLTADEVRVLGDRLVDVRNGVVPAGEDGFGICRGAGRCEQHIGRSVREPLPPGDYVFTARLRVPAVGTWPMDFIHWCEDEGPEGAPGRFVSFYEERRLELRGSPGGAPVELTPLGRLHTELGNGRQCTYMLRPVGWTIQQDLFGGYPMHAE